jgi:hypothetical protein
MRGSGFAAAGYFVLVEQQSLRWTVCRENRFSFSFWVAQRFTAAIAGSLLNNGFSR